MTQAKAIAAGTKKASRQLITTRYPQRITINPPPIECEMFQIDMRLANFFGGNQWASRRAQGGKPMPWNQPFAIQIKPSTTAAEFNPNNTFITADAPTTNAMNPRAFDP